MLLLHASLGSFAKGNYDKTCHRLLLLYSKVKTSRYSTIKQLLCSECYVPTEYEKDVTILISRMTPLPIILHQHSVAVFGPYHENFTTQRLKGTYT